MMDHKKKGDWVGKEFKLDWTRDHFAQVQWLEIDYQEITYEERDGREKKVNLDQKLHRKNSINSYACGTSVSGRWTFKGISGMCLVVQSLRPKMLIPAKKTFTTYVLQLYSMRFFRIRSGMPSSSLFITFSKVYHTFRHTRTSVLRLTEKWRPPA